MHKPLVFLDEAHAAHDPGPGMPERPARIDACREGLKDAGASLDFISPSPAARDDIARVHDAAYVEWLAEYCREGGGWIDADTPAGRGSFEVALRAVGACCEAADAAFDQDRRSFCVIRPPGHHARPDRAMGFCLLNNVAVAAARAVATGRAGKVAIVDIDVHHGNGTQEIFYPDPRVLYISIHQWPWYPWSSGDAGETGSGPGEGANLNIPMPEGSGDTAYLEATEASIIPALEQFSPDLLIVSAGFDAHRDDPLGGQEVTTQGFGRLARRLVAASEDLCKGKVVFALEGGYNLAALSEIAPAVLAALNPPVSTA